MTELNPVIETVEPVVAPAVTLDPTLSVPAVEKTPDGEAQVVADDPVAVTPKAPAEYTTFTLPDGMEIDADLLSESSALAKELDLDQAQAQKLIDLQTKDHQRAQEAQSSDWVALNEQWVLEAGADKELGPTPAQFEANTAIALKAVDVFGNDKLRVVLTDTGAGNHPEMIRFMYRVGKAISEDTVDKGQPRAQDLQSVAKRLFPSMENP